jgi:hypothetical protein
MVYGIFNPENFAETVYTLAEKNKTHVCNALKISVICEIRR